ncbi:TPA: type II toxin-antitoxin system PrlF family antitoxin [Raoultella planticola]|uniref:AbrB family transcriptional regulator n=1 Tax=Klebsiella grimontii TaxID=2058152 RepID=A0A285AV76_9ENTR|nr:MULTISPECIES: type II toxin-antitoxin system PrlF family antitoxin [Klebsiella/Raoultella group]MCA5535168.1 type II toxin-antitoxin system PrlF family antitoxin [Klebsiella pneumoniae]MCJ4716207.1 type II toxin-antitoxin system PrlF family antitoxin [Klebsiella pneumoniae]MCW9237102.1 type II toxin-antitoxin system PrlF family antitoxin [Klebsiella variicola]MCW9273946.1 type II toxin-antitoxin system PrlF family antitoxin [Klebsiella variicola]MDF3330885.1 type II toxin-antitoxin system P
MFSEKRRKPSPSSGGDIRRKARRALKINQALTDSEIPAVIRDALHLKPGEYINYTLLAGGKVIMSRQEGKQNDPVVSKFLDFIEDDMKKNPQNIAPVPVVFWEGIKALTAGVEVDLDALITDN